MCSNVCLGQACRAQLWAVMAAAKACLHNAWRLLRKHARALHQRLLRKHARALHQRLLRKHACCIAPAAAAKRATPAAASTCTSPWNGGNSTLRPPPHRRAPPHPLPSLCRRKGEPPTRYRPGACAVAPPPMARPELSEPAGFLEREIASTQTAGQLFVVASGNSGVDLDAVPLYPTSYKTDNMISVASSGANDYVSSFSNLGV